MTKTHTNLQKITRSGYKKLAENTGEMSYSI